MEPAAGAAKISISPVSLSDTAALELVADRMRQTLVEVLGEERGRSMYSTDWLRARVQQHLDGEAFEGVVLVARDWQGSIAGHAMARRERDDEGELGLFSTIFVASEWRGQGVAVALIEAIERWVVGRGLTRIRYATATHHARLIGIFERRGYRITIRTDEMVGLTRKLEPEGRASVQ